jgi:hypothetical protein
MPVGDLGAIQMCGEPIEVGMPPGCVAASVRGWEAAMGQHQHRALTLSGQLIAQDRLLAHSLLPPFVLQHTRRVPHQEMVPLGVAMLAEPFPRCRSQFPA